MRRSLLPLVAVFAAFSPTLAAADVLTAPLGRAVRLPLPGSAADIVVGNPKIADVTVISPTALFVSGRGYGSTNLIVLDRTGRTIYNGQIMVPVPNEGQVTVHRGRRSSALFCAPTCDFVVESGGDTTAAAEAASMTQASSATPTMSLPAPPAISAPAAPSLGGSPLASVLR